MFFMIKIRKKQPLKYTQINVQAAIYGYFFIIVITDLLSP